MLFENRIPAWRTVAWQQSLGAEVGLDHNSTEIIIGETMIMKVKPEAFGKYVE